MPHCGGPGGGVVGGAGGVRAVSDLDHSSDLVRRPGQGTRDGAGGAAARSPPAGALARRGAAASGTARQGDQRSGRRCGSAEIPSVKNSAVAAAAAASGPARQGKRKGCPRGGSAEGRRQRPTIRYRIRAPPTVRAVRDRAPERLAAPARRALVSPTQTSALPRPHPSPTNRPIFAAAKIRLKGQD